MRQGLPALCLCLYLGACPQLRADGNVIGKIYDPYVNQLETEFEYRLLQTDKPDSRTEKIGFGRSFGDRVFTELYLEFDQQSLTGAEAEVRYQLTEQGELDFDWGLQAELEREFSSNEWDATFTLIARRDWQRLSWTNNFSFGYEWGSGIRNEFETIVASQVRYRYKPNFEPGLEIYLAEDTRGIGPIVQGRWSLGAGKQIRWDAGVILGLDKRTPDVNWKLNIELEI